MRISETLSYYLGSGILGKRIQLYKRAMGLDGKWIDFNIQPARPVNFKSVNVKNSSLDPEEIRKKVNICPHYVLLEMIAEILGIGGLELSEFSNFCGVFVDRIMVGDSRGRHLEEGGVEKNPVSFCMTLYFLLDEALNLAKTETPQDLIFNSKSSADEVDMASAVIESWKSYLIGRELLKVWRENVPQVIQMSNSGDGEIIKMVEVLHSRLKEQVIGNEAGNTIIFSVILCPVAPKYDRNQWLHID